MRRKKAIVLALCAATGFLGVEMAASGDEQEMVDRIFRTALANGGAYELLGELCSLHPHRLSGSPEGEAANRWIETAMKERGFETRLQEVMVPYWERGDTMEVRILGDGDDETLSALALGGSVGTPDGGLTAPVVEVQSLDEVEALGEAGVGGRIVFFNRPLDQSSITHFEAYIGAADQRVSGAAKAAKFGAVAALVRSLSFRDDDFPHTGGMRYEDDAPRIPAAAISVRAAERLSQRLAADPGLEVSMRMDSRQTEDRLAHNVIGEIRGSVLPDEYITLGAHFDSWDVGEGAHDNGAGSVQVIEAVRVLREIGYDFRRSVRVVMFANEEYLVGEPFRGGRVYAEEAQAKGETHYAAFESDAGAFTPRGFGVQGSPETVAEVRSWLEYFPTRQAIHFIDDEGGGPDIWVLNELLGTTLFDMRTDTQRYLDYHHSAHDTFDQVNRRELELGTGAVASLLYLIDSQGLAEPDQP